MLQNHEKIIQRQKFQINNPSNYHGKHVRASRGNEPQMCGFPHNYALYFIPGRPQGIAPTGGFPKQLRIMNYELP